MRLNHRWAALICVAVLTSAMSVMAGDVPATAASPVLQVWLTTTDGANALTQQPNITLGPVSSGSTNIYVNDARTYQVITGFGAAFTDASTYLLHNVATSSQLTSALTNVFSPANGIGLSFMRIPMGASDFIEPATFYTYDDRPAGQTDPNLTNFSASHDQLYTIPVIKDALAVNPNIKLFANPWSPPAWMKTNGSLAVDPDGDSATEPDGDGDPGTLIASDYTPLANYFVKFLQAYQSAGVPIWAITPQNEPQQNTIGYPGMLLQAGDESNWISSYLKPALTSAGLSTQILGYDYNWNLPSYPQTLLSNSTTAGDMAGVAWHCYVGDPTAMTSVHNSNLYPVKDQYETECSPGPFLGMDAADKTILSLQNWARGVDMWNLALDQNGQPNRGDTCGGCRGLVTVSNTTGQVSYTLDYYELGQVSKFAPPGSVRIGSTASVDGVETVAFRTPSGSEVLVAHNTGSSPDTFTSTWNEQGSFSYTLPAGATVTFTGTVPAQQIVPTTYQLVNRNSGKVLDISGGSTASGATAVQSTSTAATSQQWTVQPTSGGAYDLVNVNSKLVLDDPGSSTTSGTQLQQVAASGTTDQQWRIASTDNGYYTVTNSASGLVAGVAGGSASPGAAVDQETSTGAASQQWSLLPVPESGVTYTLVNRNTDKTLGVSGGGTGDGVPTVQWTGTGHPDQSWTLNAVGGGYQFVHFNNEVLDDTNRSLSSGNQLQQWTSGGTGATNQLWSLTPAGDGYYTITNELSGLVVGVSGAALSDNAAVDQETATGATSQEWQLVPLPSAAPPVSCRITYSPSVWSGGFNANLVIYNTGSSAINGWTVTFTFPGDEQITSFWNATVTQNGANVTAVNTSSNPAISPGANTSFGFQGTWTNSSASPATFFLNGTLCSQ